MLDIAIIGGGASGLMAACECIKLGYSVAIFEATDRVGKKILASGNGKCNLTHKAIDINCYNTSDILPILNSFPPKLIADKFIQFGVLTKLINDNYYPYSEQASSVLNCLRTNSERAKTYLGTKIVSVDTITAAYCLCDEVGARYTANKVCFACGSKATMGIDSSNILERLGYKIKPMRPSLLPILADKQSIKGMSGVRCKVKATIKVDDITRSAEGEILFKDNALSGIVSFCLSATLARSKRDDCLVTIDFAPEYSLAELEKILSTVGIDNMYHKSIVSALLLRAQSQADLARVIKAYTVKCYANSDFKQAQVMSGGLDIGQINLDDMSLKNHNGLYAIGEALDVDGECGGYNLHWAWASAMAFAKGLEYAKQL